MLWQILICSIPHRHEKLCELLACLDPQMTRPDVGALLYLDNLEVPYGDKTQALVEASHARYISCADDDDLVAPGFVSRVTEALMSRPDYVGFPVRWTRDGQLRQPVEHSLAHGRWFDTPEMLYRDIAQFNPIRRELALTGRWAGGNGAERRWANQVRAAGLVRKEVWIPEPMYYYREELPDTFLTPREPYAPEDIQPPPRYPWLKSIGYFPS